MSIYATLWTLKFPSEGNDYHGCDWVEVRAQGVPAHIGTPKGYESGDPYGSFLPPPVETDEDGESPFMRAVVFVKVGTTKGKKGHPQEYDSTLVMLTGEEYESIPFERLHRLICDALRGDKPSVVMQMFGCKGSPGVLVRERKKQS